MILRWRPSPDIDWHVRIHLHRTGGHGSPAAWGMANRLGKPEAAERYLEEMAQAIGGTVRRYERNWPGVVDANGRPADAAALLGVGHRWKEAIARLITELRQDD